MEYLQTLFGTESIASTVIYLCLAAILGLYLGKLEVRNLKLGVAGVLFSGLLLAHLGAPIDKHVLHFIRDFGLILFVYSIGIDMGPRFFSSFRKDGIVLNLLALTSVLGGVGMAYLIHVLTDTPPAIVAGILSGAVTNTPSLGAAQQVLSEQGGEMSTLADEAGMAYALAYPFGIIGIIITLMFIRLAFRIKVDKEVEEYQESLSCTETKLERVTITVSNPNLYGRSISYLSQVTDRELVISRIYRNGDCLIATDDETLQEGDILLGVSSRNMIESLELKIGKVETLSNQADLAGPLAAINVLITNHKIVGKTIEQIGIYRRYPANITRILRNGSKILPTRTTTLELGDTVKVVGKKDALKDIRRELGDSVKELAKPNIVSIFLGVLIGILVGSIPIFLPGLPAPAKLGLAGGPLLVAILLGHKGRIGSLSFYMTPGTSYFMKEFGIILFLACVGLLSGRDFVKTIVEGGWHWMIYGVAITLIPIMLVGIIGRMLKINYLKLCGCIAGSMTDPPALEFANGIAPVQAQSTAYATVYPLTMFLRVLLAQIFLLLTL